MGIGIKKEHQRKPMAVQMFSPGGGNKYSTVALVCTPRLRARMAIFFIYKMFNLCVLQKFYGSNIVL